VTVDVSNSCCVPVYATFNSGHSWSQWTGTNPWNMDTMRLGDTYKAEGVSVQVSYYPPGGGFSGSGDTVSWSGSAPSTWSIDHYYNGIQFSTGWTFTQFRQTTSGEGQYGSLIYTTYANGYSSI
jgi:hypothetical protein